MFLSLCLSVPQSVRPVVRPSVCCLPVCLPFCLSVCLPVSLSVRVCVYLFVRLSGCLSDCLFACLCLSVCLFVCLSVCRHVHCQNIFGNMYATQLNASRSVGLRCPWWYGVQPRKDGLGTPPFLGFFYSYTLRRHPKTLNTNTTPSMHLLWGTLGPGSVMPNFGVFLETPFWARTPLGTPLPNQEGGFLGGFLGRNPPFLDPSYDPSCPEAIAHKSVCWGLNRIVPPH